MTEESTDPGIPAEESARMDIHSALLTIQQKLNAPKDLDNLFGKYKYRSCESILAAAKSLLNLTKTTLIFRDSISNINDRFYITSEAILSNGAECISAFGIAREDLAKKGMDGAQITGATSSYARKYALNALFAIDDNKDIDTLARHATTDKEITAQAIHEIKMCENTSQLMSVFNAYNAVVPNLCVKDAPIQVALSRRKVEIKEADAKADDASPQS